MAINITFRHMDSTEALKDYVHTKLERVQKYLRAPLDAHVTMHQVKHQFCAEMQVQASGKSYKASHESEDLYKSLDYVIDKVEGQIARAHDAAARGKKGGPTASEVGAHATEGEEGG